MDQATARAFDRDTQGQRVTRTATATSDKKDRRDNPIFIRSELDDYGLTPNELRVYARIARRAGETSVCYESIPNMADAIGLGESTVRRCCQVLALARLISEETHEGYTTDRRILPMTSWKNKAELKGLRNIVLRGQTSRTPVSRDRGVAKATPVIEAPEGFHVRRAYPCHRSRGYPCHTRRTKVIPLKVLPLK